MNSLRPATGRAFGMKAKLRQRDAGLQVAPIQSFGRLSLTLPRPGEQRKETCVAADPQSDVQGLTVATFPEIRVVMALTLP